MLIVDVKLHRQNELQCVSFFFRYRHVLQVYVKLFYDVRIGTVDFEYEGLHNAVYCKDIRIFNV